MYSLTILVITVSNFIKYIQQYQSDTQTWEQAYKQENQI